MDSVTVSDRDKKIIIWNFMEELWENHQNAVKNKLDTRFKFMDFYNVGLLSQYLKKTGVEGLPEKLVTDTLKVYENETGNIEIKDNRVKLTKKGLIECQKPKHEWD
jgi:5-methylcytosine-specific restriction endonuclease McrBC regulatory subunit McrC